MKKEKPKFVYVTEIAVTPEELWAALISNEFWQNFSGSIESDWKVGSIIKFFLPDGTQYSQGVILESSPPHILSHTWPEQESEETADGSVARLTWRLERGLNGTVKLTMLHEELSEKAYQGVSQGWPMILDGLKSLLETGKGLPSTARQ